MNNSVALLYNFNEEKLKMIKMVCMMMQVRFKEVARAEYEQPLGALLGISGIENHGEVYQGEEFQEEGHHQRRMCMPSTSASVAIITLL